MKKLADTIHYIIATADSKKLGKTKLNKILWYADRFFMLKYLDSITHSEYIKMQYGPVPKDIDKVLKALEKEGKILQKRDELSGKYEFISLKEPDLSSFTPQEISVLDKIIYTINHKYTAQQISNLSHDEDWKSVKIGEVIPIESILANYATEDIIPEELEEAKAIFED